MWALFDFACEGKLLGSSRTFKQEYENPIVRVRTCLFYFAVRFLKEQLQSEKFVRSSGSRVYRYGRPYVLRGADVGVTILRKKRGTVNSLWQTMFAECNLTIQGIIAALKMVNLSPRDSKKTWFCSLLFLCNGIHCTVNSPKSQDTSMRLTFPKNGHLQSVPAYWPFEVQNPMTIGQCCV